MCLDDGRPPLLYPDTERIDDASQSPAIEPTSGQLYLESL